MRYATIVCLSMAGCSLDLGVPANLSVTCSTNAECPDGTVCDTNVGTCVSSDTPTLRVELASDAGKRFTRVVPFTVEILSASAAAPFDLQVEFRNADESTVRWRPLTLTLDSPAVTQVVGSPSGTSYELSWDALADAVAGNGLELARVDLEADGQVADPIVAPARIVIRVLGRSASGALRSAPTESLPTIIGNAPPVATILDVIGDSGVINVVLGLSDANSDSCGFELQFRGPDGVWRNAALQYGNVADLGCLASRPLNASVGWNSTAELFAPEVQPASTPQGVGRTIIPNSENTGRVSLRARAYDQAEAARAEQHWGIWSSPFVITRIVNETPPLVIKASAPATSVAGSTGPIHVRYTVVDEESDPVSATISYSHDAGVTWHACAEYPYAFSEGTAQLVTAPAGDGGIEHLFTWDASRVQVATAHATQLRIVLSDGSLAPTSTAVFQIGSPAAPSGRAPHDGFLQPLFSSPLFKSDGTSVAVRPSAVAIADFNNDGLKDLVFTKRDATAGNSFSIFRNTGASTPWPQTYLAGASNLVVAADVLANPARQSIVSVNDVGSAIAYAGNGNMTFTADTGFSLGGPPLVLLARDLDNDGDDDLITLRDDGGGTSTLQVFRNSGVAGARYSVSFSVSYGSRPMLAAGDLDLDGFTDIAVLVERDDGRVLAGNGSGGFTQIATFPGETASNEQNLGIGDFDGDGFPDLVNLGNGSIMYLIGSTSGAVLTYEPVAYDERGSPLGNANIADMNADGLADVVVVNNTQLLVVNLTSVEADGLPHANLAQVPLDTFDLATAADLDGDHVAEVIASTGNGTGAITVLSVDGPSTRGGQTFRRGATLTENDNRGVSLIASFDGDGIADLLQVDGTPMLRRGIGAAGVGDAAFGPPEFLSISDNTVSVVDARTADVNGDGVLDVVFVAQVGEQFDYTLQLGWFLARPLQGVGDGRFAPMRLLPVVAGGAGSTFPNGGALATADFDADGLDDAAYLFFSSTQSTWHLVVSFSRGASGFVQQDAVYTVAPNVRDLAVGYLAGDSLPDLIAIEPSTTVRTFTTSGPPVARNNPFTLTALTFPSNVDDAHLADLNWDGVMDIWSRLSTTLEIRNGNVGGGFGGVIEVIVNAALLNAAYLDVTMDGINDFVYLGFPVDTAGGVQVGAAPLGVPNTSFFAPTTFAAERLFSELRIAATDITCDGASDLVASLPFATFQVLVHERDMFGPQLSVAALPYDGRHSSTLASLGLTGPAVLHPWHIASGPPCSEHERWEDALRVWRATHADSPRFRVLSPGRYLGETQRYRQTRIGDELRWVRSSRFTPALDVAVEGAPRGLIATLTVAPGRRASVVAAKLRVYRQNGDLTSAAELPQDSQAGSANAAQLLAQLPTGHGLVDVARRTWVWEEIPKDADGNLRTGTGKRYRYDATTGLVDILTDEGGFYVVVEDL